MEFRYVCLSLQHLSGRVTVLPLELPEFTVHAVSEDRATEDLTLAVDDQIVRLHPRKLSRFARSGGGELLVLDVPVLPVWGPQSVQRETLRVYALAAPAHKPFIEVRAPKLDLRVWLLPGEDLAARAAKAFQRFLQHRNDHQLIGLRPESQETLLSFTVAVKPPPLASLKRKQLKMDLRPPPVPEDLELDKGKKVTAEQLATSEDELDDYNDDYDGKKKKAKPAEAKLLTPVLNTLGVPLHTLAREDELEPAYEREELVNQLLRRVNAKAPEAIMLVGNAGCGKTAVIYELARRLRAKHQVAPLDNEGKKPRERLMFMVDASRLIAGDGFFGAWQEQTLNVLREARQAQAILALGHGIELLDAGKSAHSDANVAQILGPALAARELYVLAEATPEEWARLERRNQSFASAWTVLRVSEPDAATTRKILFRVAAELGKRLRFDVKPEATDTVLGLTKRFWPYGSHLGSSVTFLRRLVDARRHAKAKHLGRDETIEAFSQESGIPLVLLRDDLRLDPADLRTFLSERVLAQPVAVERVADVVSVIKAGMSNTQKPIGVLFFAGPTGVGKTELTKALAEFVFGAKDRMVRLDMGEYATGDALARLVGEGSVQGYLTGAVRRQPFCVVLFDEIEKAHPAVFDALLGVLGEGRLTDAEGKFTDFRNAIIVMTSNLGADTLKARVGFDGQGDAGANSARLRAHYLSEARSFFRPEMFNRIDDFVVFEPLGATVVRQIVDRELGKLSQREGFKRRDFELHVQPEARDTLVSLGFDPRYGARPLKRAIEQHLIAPVGHYLAAHPTAAMVRLVAESSEAESGAKLSLRSENLGSGQESAQAVAARTRTRAILADVARLRWMLQRWARSPLMTELRHRLAFFDKASRARAFWLEHDLAEAEAQRAQRARDLVGKLQGALQQAEAIEDLAFEAYYDRSLPAAESLAVELRGVMGELNVLLRMMYATLYPQKRKVWIYLTAGRTSWHWVSALVRYYRDWAQQAGLETTVFCSQYIPPESRPNTKPDDPMASWRWAETSPPEGDSPMPIAASVCFEGDGVMLLAGEHGSWRIVDGSSTSLVRTVFWPNSPISNPAMVEKHISPTEIRRLSPSKPELRDTRTDAHVTLEDGRCDLEPLIKAWLNLRVFGEDADPWN